MDPIAFLQANPIISLVIGIAILIFPRIINYVIAAVFIYIGAHGIWPDIFAGAPELPGVTQ